MPADIRAVMGMLPFGAPTGCVGGGSCGCGCSGGCGCGGGAGQGLAPVPIPEADCIDSPWTPCPSGQPSYNGVGVGGQIDAITALGRTVAAGVAGPLALAESCGDIGVACCRIKPAPIPGGPPPPLAANGGALLLLQLQTPAAGPADPRPLLTFYPWQSSLATIGTGWNDAYNRHVSAVSSTAADVISGRGVTYNYSSLDAGTNYYTPPGEAQNSLHKETSGWTETQVDGVAFRYDSFGSLTYVKGAGGLRTTLIYTGVPPILSYIQAPTGARTTYGYDVSSKLRRIQDPAGRITSLTVGGSSLRRMITPDGQRTSLGYASPVNLVSITNPEGERTTLAYSLSLSYIRRRVAPGARSPPTRPMAPPRASR